MILAMVALFLKRELTLHYGDSKEVFSALKGLKDPSLLGF